MFETEIIGIAVKHDNELREVPRDTQSGEDLDVVEPSAADDDWYKKGSVYTDENGRKLEVFF